jgi:hypothetical protein
VLHAGVRQLSSNGNSEILSDLWKVELPTTATATAVTGVLPLQWQQLQWKPQIQRMWTSLVVHDNTFWTFGGVQVTVIQRFFVNIFV